MNLGKLQETVEDRYRGAWCAATYEVSKRWAGLSNWITTTIKYYAQEVLNVSAKYNC